MAAAGAVPTTTALAMPKSANNNGSKQHQQCQKYHILDSTATGTTTCGSGPLLHMAGYLSPKVGFKLLVLGHCSVPLLCMSE
jgi:hypothetical protein